nr:MAG: hypothetical protein J07AB56_00910 [Candidatus Nanosalinarum sp. J07AB56]
MTDVDARIAVVAVVGAIALSAGVITVLPGTVSMGTEGEANGPVGTATDQTEGDSGSLIDITDRIADNPSQRRYGIAAVQVDGETQLFSTGFGGPNQLLRWRDGNLVEDTPRELRDPTTNAIGAAGCDIDGDGQEEIYTLTTGGRYGGQKDTKDRLYDLQDGEWVDLLQESEVTNQYTGRSVACHHSPQGYGFFVARYAGPMQLITESNGSLIDLAPRYDMDRVTGGRSIVNIPTEDGVDLFVGNERYSRAATGENFYYRQNRSSGTYEEVAAELGVADPRQAARGAEVFDKDKDGDLDLGVVNWEGPHRLYRSTDRGFEGVAPPEFSDPTASRNLVSGDFDNDGGTELYINNIASQGEQPNSYHNASGAEIPVGDAREPDGLGTGAARVDIDGDGNLELILAHGEAGAQPLTMYRHRNSGESVRIQPMSESSAPARNALVEVESTGQVFVVDGGSGYLNQMEPWVHIGGAEPPINVTVTFPDGTRAQQTVRQTASKVAYPQN